MSAADERLAFVQKAVAEAEASGGDGYMAGIQAGSAWDHEHRVADACEFDAGYEGVDESTPPPGYCQEAWDYVRGMREDPISRDSGCAGEFIEDFERKHYHKCEVCAKRIDLARMP